MYLVWIKGVMDRLSSPKLDDFRATRALISPNPFCLDEFFLMIFVRSDHKSKLCPGISSQKGGYGYDSFC